MAEESKIDRTIGHFLNGETVVGKPRRPSLQGATQIVEDVDDLRVPEKCELAAMSIDDRRQQRLKRIEIAIQMIVHVLVHRTLELAIARRRWIVNP